MSTPQITANSVLMNPAEVNPHAQTAQIMTVSKAKDAFLRAEEKAKSDSVNISKEALMMSKEAQELEDEAEYDREERDSNEDAQEKV
ncbi:hypothetical protein OR1_04170 [Geobacter sp. OR-1]|uniref:hypothetical protein n=1 Tax=Geobacter sp. OR-1 TaxID=1266765 RepID=UPI000542B30C|nr:hypothetical protein [Geobacter sp. OR-1]GAM11851.1 hypothetical protein OR1_04170 [Geobacter sp. OR-1]